MNENNNMRDDEPGNIMLAEAEDDGRFPGRLHLILSEAADGTAPSEIGDIMGFQPHGRAFRILNEERFCNIVLPLLFPFEVSWPAFLHQLTLYGFRRLVNAGPDQGAFYHACFMRYQPELAARITIPRRNRSNNSLVLQQDEPELTRLPVLVPRWTQTQTRTRPSQTNVTTTRTDRERPLMYEPRVGASTLPPDQFDSPVLVGLLMMGMNRTVLAGAGVDGRQVPRNHFDDIDDIIRNALRDA